MTNEPRDRVGGFVSRLRARTIIPLKHHEKHESEYYAAKKRLEMFTVEIARVYALAVTTFPPRGHDVEMMYARVSQKRQLS